MLKQFTNKSVVIIMLFVSIAGCMSTPVKESDTKVDSSTIEKPAVIADFKVSGALQQRYKAALEYMQSEDYRQAISSMEKIVAEEPRISGPWINIAIAYRKLDEIDKAESAIQKALELNPDNPYALNQAGIIMREMGKFAASEELYKRALAEYPNYSNAHLNLAILCDLYLQKIVCAKSHYQAYQELNQESDKGVVAWLNDLDRRSAGSK
jgi:Tfp pilus assembly protein PilF